MLRAVHPWHWLALLLALSGCGASDGPARLPVSGHVVGDGAESIVGSVSFSPAKGNEGLGGTCALSQGAYQFDRTNGPTAGLHDVIIRRNPTKPTTASKEKQPRMEWKLQADIPAKGPYQIDLKLD